MNGLSSQRRIRGFTLVELFLIIAVLAVVIGMLLPNLARPPRAYRIKCVNNLKNVGLAFRIFAVDNQDRFPMEVSTSNGGSMEFVERGTVFRHFMVMSNELSTPKILLCPNDSRRKPATNFTSLCDANVSYFVGLNTSVARTNAFLAGDRNLTIDGRPVRPGLVQLTSKAVVGWSSEIHNCQGNIAMGDGIVQQLNDTRLAAALHATQLLTNRLAVP